MNKIILILLSFVLLNAFKSEYTPHLNKYLFNAQCDKILKNTLFDICYSYSYKTPKAVAYYITKNEVEAKNLSRDNMHFRADYRIPRRYRAYPSDYVGSEYDRGHNAANDVFNFDREIQKQTFLMTNIAPQAKWLNRVYWKKVERFARIEAVKYNKVEVVTGNCGSKGKINSEINIPKYWYKLIYVPKINKTYVFIAPNTDTGMKEAPLKKYQSNISSFKMKCFSLFTFF